MFVIVKFLHEVQRPTGAGPCMERKLPLKPGFTGKRLFFSLFFWVVVVSLIDILHAGNDIRFLSGLSERNLFQSVESFCDREFRNETLTLEKRYSLAGELVRSRTRRMLLETPDKRQDILAGLTHFETEILSRNPADFSKAEESLARISLSVQFAIAAYQIGNWQRLEAEVASRTDRLRLFEEAKGTVRNALDRFSRCLETLASLQQKLGRNADTETEKQILALERSIRFQQGLAQQSFALTFPEGSDDRRIALEQTIEILAPIATLRIKDASVVRAGVELAACFRMLGQLSQSQEILQRLGVGETANDPAFQSELIRYHLAVDKLDEALQIFRVGRSDSRTYPDYDLARIELFLALSSRLKKKANTASDNESVQKQIEQVDAAVLDEIRGLEKRSGAYWGRRARMLLSTVSSAGAVSSQGDPKILAALAEDQFQNGHYAEAIDLFKKASHGAELSGDPESAFKNSLAAVAVLARLAEQATIAGTLTDADKADCNNRLIESLRQLAVKYFARKESSELHLKAIDLAGEAVLNGDMTPGDYLDLLKEYVGLWPGSAKVPPLLLRAAILLEQQGNALESLGLLEKIPNDVSVASEAIDTAVRCLQHLNDNDSFDPAKWFSGRLKKERQSWTANDSRCAILAAEHFMKQAKLLLSKQDRHEAVDHLAEAERLLHEVDHSSLDKNEKARCRVMLVSVQNWLGKKNEATRTLQTLNDELLDKLSKQEKQDFRRTQAAILAETGQVQQAVDLLSESLKQKPGDLADWEALGEILSRQNSEASLQKAIQIWGHVESRSSKGGTTWWTARERKIDIQLKQGKRDEALEAYELLKTLYPELGGAARKSRFENKFKHPSKGN